MEKLRRELEEKRAEALRAQSALNSKETVRISSSLVFLLLTFASVDVYISAISATFLQHLMMKTGWLIDSLYSSEI